MRIAIACVALALTVGAALADDTTVARDGLLLSWEARDLRDHGSASVVADRSGHGNDAAVWGPARVGQRPPCLELGGQSALVGGKPIRPKTIAVEALFRADRADGRGLQLIVTTFDAKPGRAGSGNSRQWVLELRGAPPQPPNEYPAFLTFGIFGEDGQWHFALSNARLDSGWHHAIGTFDGKAVRLYLDGLRQRRFRPDPTGRYIGTLNQPPDDTINVPAIGRNSPDSPYGLEGAVALARVYSRGLFDDEVAGNYAYARSLVPELGTKRRQTVRRAKAPFKVLFSNDTTNILTCVSPYHAKGGPFTPEMLQATVDEVAGVDVHMLQPGLGWIPWWKSQAYPADEHYRWFEEQTGLKADPFGQYMLAGGDMVQVFVDRCWERGQVPFVSLRLNDGHHLENIGKKHRMAAWVSRFYEEHPEYRIGEDLRSWDQHVHNWGIPEVREHKFAFISEICEQYDIDGFELDFMRHCNLFRADETTFDERAAIITGFVARVRELLERTAKPGQRRWLCARVPCFLPAHDRLGIDLPAMVEAGLDMVNLSAHYFTQQQTDLALIRELVPDAAVYLEMTHCTTVGPSRGGYDSFSYRRTTDEQFHTAAHLAYQRGADGMSLFNFVYFREHGTPGRGPFNEPPLHVLKRLGEPEWLAQQPQWYVLAKTWNTPTVPDRPLSRTFRDGSGYTFALDMAPRPGGGDGVLRLMTKEDCSACQWVVTIDGEELTRTEFRAKPLDHPYDAALGEPNQYACFGCPRDLLRDGANRIGVSLSSGGPVTVEYLDVVLP